VQEKDHGPTYTNVNLQGETGKKYAVGFYTSPKPHRPSLAPKWPSTPEENLMRLANAGVPLDRGIDLCNNCKEPGHKTGDCPQEKLPIEGVKIECALCGEEGHRCVCRL